MPYVTHIRTQVPSREGKLGGEYRNVEAFGYIELTERELQKLSTMMRGKRQDRIYRLTDTPFNN